VAAIEGYNDGRLNARSPVLLEHGGGADCPPTSDAADAGTAIFAGTPAAPVVFRARLFPGGEASLADPYAVCGTGGRWGWT
jgi:hypothetical protein